MIVSQSILFIMLSYIAFLLIDFSTKRALNTEPELKKENIIIILRSVSLIVTITFIGVMQLNYINKKLVLQDYRCQYYDEYDNIVFVSVMDGVCPDIEVTQQDSNQFSFNTFSEESYNFVPDGVKELGLMNDIDSTTDTKVYIITDTTVTYDDSNHPAFYELKMKIVVEFNYMSQKTYQSYSSHRRQTITEVDGYFHASEDFVEKVETNLSSLSLNLTAFESEDYITKKLYQKIIPLEYGDEEALIRESFIDGVLVKNVLGYTNTHINDSSQIFFGFVQTETSSGKNVFTKSYSCDSWGCNSRMTSRQLGATHFTLTHSRRHEENYMYYSYIGGTQYYPKDTVWNHRISDPITNIDVYSTGVHMFSVEETEYGRKVTRKMHRNYDLLKSIEKNETIKKLHAFNPYINHLYDYEYILTNKKMDDPQYIINEFFPLYN